jgi:hypothetical protein
MEDSLSVETPRPQMMQITVVSKIVTEQREAQVDLLPPTSRAHTPVLYNR